MLLILPANDGEQQPEVWLRRDRSVLAPDDLGQAALIAAGGMLTAPASNADSASYVDPMSYGQQTGQPAGQE